MCELVNISNFTIFFLLQRIFLFFFIFLLLYIIYKFVQIYRIIYNDHNLFSSLFCKCNDQNHDERPIYVSV